jgi:predicted kinase
VDATFQDAKRRRDFVDLAMRWNTPVLFVECRAAQEAILKRLERRAASANEPSDATRETYLRQRDDFMPIIEVPANSHLIVGTDGASPAEIFDRLEVALPSR